VHYAQVCYFNNVWLMFLVFFKNFFFQTTVRGHCPSGVTVTDRPSELIYMIWEWNQSFTRSIWKAKYKCCAVPPFGENLQFGFNTLKFICRRLSSKGFSQSLSKFEPSNSILFNFFQIQEHPDLNFELGPVPCTHYTFSNAKDYVSTKFYKQIKTRVYLNIELNN